MSDNLIRIRGADEGKGDGDLQAEISLYISSLAEQLTNDQLAELNHLKWQYEMPGLPKLEPCKACKGTGIDGIDGMACRVCNPKPEPEIEELTLLNNHLEIVGKLNELIRTINKLRQ